MLIRCQIRVLHTLLLINAFCSSGAGVNGSPAWQPGRNRVAQSPQAAFAAPILPILVKELELAVVKGIPVRHATVA